MKNVHELMVQQKAGQNPGHMLGSFLLDHSNSPEYLVSQLTAYLEAAQADLAAERAMFRTFFHQAEPNE